MIISIPITKSCKNISGEQFGRLLAISPVGKTIDNKYQWLCICDCGTEHITTSNHLNRGLTKSCGCLNAEISKERYTIHGLHGHPLYYIWTAMRSRCNTPSNKAYKNYGGRGISTCKEWDDFTIFLKDMGERPSNKYCIERIDNNKGYFPSNCKWATRKEQNRNTRSNRMITHNNKTMCVADWSDVTGLSAKCIRGRLDAGWSPHKALTRPLGRWIHASENAVFDKENR